MDLVNYVEDCTECIDQTTQERDEAVCAARRTNGICPQLPVIEQLVWKMNWLAELWKMDADPNEVCGIDRDLTVEDILKAAQEAADTNE